MSSSQLLSQGHLQSPDHKPLGSAGAPVGGGRESTCHSTCWSRSQALPWVQAAELEIIGRGRQAAPAGLFSSGPAWDGFVTPRWQGADRPAGRPAPQGRPGACWAAGSPVGSGRATTLRVGPCTRQPCPVPPVLGPGLPVHTGCRNSIILARAKPSLSLPKAWWRYCLLQEVSPDATHWLLLSLCPSCGS